MIRVLIEKTCPRCEKKQYVKSEVTQVQWDWLQSHLEHLEHCPHCNPYGRSSRPIDMDQIEQRFWKDGRLDIIAESLGITPGTAMRALTEPEDCKAWRETAKELPDKVKAVRRHRAQNLEVDRQIFDVMIWLMFILSYVLTMLVAVVVAATLILGVWG